MSPNANTDRRIDLPSAFANHLASVGNLDRTPETLAEYWSMFGEQLQSSGESIESGDMYVDEPKRHEVQLNDRIRYSPCVIDALTAAILEPQSPLTVRSVDPVTATPVEITVMRDSIHYTPDEAVLTFGIAPSIPDLESSDESIFEWMIQSDRPSVSSAFCQYINAFESDESYRQWEAETDGVTIPVQPASVEALIRGFIDIG